MKWSKAIGGALAASCYGFIGVQLAMSDVDIDGMMNFNLHFPLGYFIIFICTLLLAWLWTPHRSGRFLLVGGTAFTAAFMAYNYASRPPHQIKPPLEGAPLLSYALVSLSLAFLLALSFWRSRKDMTKQTPP